MVDPVGTIVVFADTSNVDSVFVAGQAVKRNGQLVDAELDQIFEKLDESRNHILGQAGCFRSGRPSRRQPSEVAAGSVVVVGGTQGLGREVAQSYADDGRDVIVTGRDQARAEAAAGEIGGSTRGLGFDLCDPHSIEGQMHRRGRRRLPRARRHRA